MKRSWLNNYLATYAAVLALSIIIGFMLATMFSAAVTMVVKFGLLVLTGGVGYVLARITVQAVMHAETSRIAMARVLPLVGIMTVVPMCVMAILFGIV
ncbi:hypothetical protein [Marinobacter shengliensis]|uniref:hypothetical protein n=1 Tax=Marinobacter shengliensis TaxID=1389223 RepID=UPI0011085BD5|nr:hypothetical protein [Marinobacter shengliensis]